MAQTRSTIELLVNILEENGTTKLTAEIFRLAKFDNDDAVKPLWKLLFELVYYCEFKKIDATSVQACSQLTTEEMAVYVKRALQSRGFMSKEFACLPNDMSDGSRELLLAFGWLMCKEDIISCFMNNCTLPLEDGKLSNSSLISNLQTDQSGDSKQDKYDKLQQLLLLNNKLRLSLRTLSALQKENSLLKHRIHECTYGVTGSGGDRKHLSQLEVYMLQQPQILQNNLTLLEQDNQRLQHLLSWRNHEDVFWRWMGSVLDAKQQSQASATGETEGETQQTEKISANLKAAEAMCENELQQSHLTLGQSITKYQAILSHLEDMWQEKRTEVTDEELDLVLLSIEQELSVQRANVMLKYVHNPSTDRPTDIQELPLINSTFSPPKEPQLHFEQAKQHMKTRTDKMSSVVDNAAENIVDIECEMEQLSKLVEQIEVDVAGKEAHLKHHLQSLSNQLQDTICIPPMDPKC